MTYSFRATINVPISPAATIATFNTRFKEWWDVNDKLGLSTYIVDATTVGRMRIEVSGNSANYLSATTIRESNTAIINLVDGRLLQLVTLFP